MKKFILIAACAFTLSSCGHDRYDQREIAAKAVESNDLQLVVGDVHWNLWAAKRKDGTVCLIRTADGSETARIIELFPAK